MQPYNLERKYGVVRFVGTLHYNRNHELVFESDDPLEVMQQLETLCRTEDSHHGHMTVIRHDEH
jgi:peptide methionine sulfoxide reductase MsrB